MTSSVTLDPFRVPVTDIRLPRNVPAGCDLAVIGLHVCTLRKTNEDPDPILIDAEPDGTWRVADGRHRFLAAVIAGRQDVLCTTKETP